MSKVKGIPEGMHTLTPVLTIRGAAEAIEFYKKAFGAVEVMRSPDPSGKKIWHATLRIGDSHLFLSDEMPAEFGGKPGKPVELWLYFDNVDQAFKRATDAGAKVEMPLADMFWGDRFGKVTDQWGNGWALAQHVKDLSPEEMQKARDAFLAQMAQQRK